MDQGTAPDPALWSLRSRGPAHAVSHRCLEVQRAARPRRFFGRLFGFDPLHPDALPWYRRALDERRVGRILAELGREWRVLHAVPQGEGATDIAHLIIGPPGVLALTSGVESGIASADAEARLASRSLTRATGSPIVVGAIVVVAEPGGAPAPSSTVAVVSASRLLRHLRGLPAVFGPDLVASVTRAAEEWTTWRPFSVDAAHTDPDDAFLLLHTEVTRARVRRALWQSVGVATLTAPVLLIVANLFF